MFLRAVGAAARVLQRCGGIIISCSVVYTIINTRPRGCVAQSSSYKHVLHDVKNWLASKLAFRTPPLPLTTRGGADGGQTLADVGLSAVAILHVEEAVWSSDSDSSSEEEEEEKEEQEGGGRGGGGGPSPCLL